MNTAQIHKNKVAGQSVFTDDIFPKDLLYGITVRSRIPRGEIRSVAIGDLPPAYTSVMASDIPGKNRIPLFRGGMPFLAHKEVNYIGEPVILLAGPDYATLQNLAYEIEIEYNDQTPFFSPEDETEERLTDTITYSKGDVRSLLEGGYNAITKKYYTGSQEHLYLEPQSAIAAWDGQNLVCHVATRAPFLVRECIAEMLGLSNRKIRVIVPEISDPFEGKIFFPILVAGHAALLSFRTGKPVKIVYSRHEDISFSFKRPATIITHTSVIDGEGKLLGLKTDIVFDTGAYNVISDYRLKSTTPALFKQYDCDNVDVNVRFVSTNKVPAGRFSGSGEPQIVFASELHASIIAKTAQMDPYIWKKKNLKLLPEGISRQKNKTIIPHAIAVLDEVINISDFLRKYGAYEAVNKRRLTQQGMETPLRGIGISLSSRNTGLEPQKVLKQSVGVSLHKNKKVTIATSLVDPDGSKYSYLADVASGILNISVADIDFESIDTSRIPDSGPTMYSRMTYLIGKTIEQCCLLINKKKGKNPLPIEVKRKIDIPDGYNPANDKKVPTPPCSGAWEATVVEVEVDPVTYMTTCRGIWIVIHAGHINIPEAAREQVEAAALQNLGFTSMEVLDFKNGRVYQNRISDYTIPGIEDLPDIRVHFLENGSGPEQAPSLDLGDQAVTGVAPAYIAAIIQATGIDVTSIPLIPETIQDRMEEM
ncbi:MAG: xanthine dehydrogenase family protein molybdopterin-binding subunit [Spirochaetales bacterium]|nr:xanthine dehydrogenase family protein molybdopterin-binding subunit [Spirochaetales bacterium]